MKKVFLIIIVLLVVIIVAGAVFVYFYKDKIVAKSVEKGFEAVETLVVQNLPETASADSVKAIFTQAMDKVKSGEINTDKLQGVFMTFKESWSDQNLDSLEVQKLVEQMQKLAGAN